MTKNARLLRILDKQNVERGAYSHSCNKLHKTKMFSLSLLSLFVSFFFELILSTALIPDKERLLAPVFARETFR